MNLTKGEQFRERDQEHDDALIHRLEQLVQANQGLRHALPISGMGLAELRSWLNGMGHFDLWESLSANSIGGRP